MIRVLKFFVTLYFEFFYNVELINKSNFPKSGRVIVCANHVGSMDMFFMCYRLNRLVHFMAKEELFKIPILGSVIKWLGAFPVNRKKADVASFKASMDILNKGDALGIFPQGTRIKSTIKRNMKAKPGAVLLAIKTGAPILPVGIEGNYKLFGKVKVVFGEPYHIKAKKDKKYSKEELEEMSNKIMEKVYELLE